jgi:tRNA dimethylallyltransferase
MGATATGKTALALALHDALPVEIISVDSSQVYRGMDIGTAKPTMEEQARAPHRLIDIRDPAEAYSAADFCADALREMEAIWRAGRIPLLVGGTMFYFHALEFGLAPLPSADPGLRARLTEEAGRLGWPAMHSRLAEIDPVTAARIHPNDAQRIQRALEFYELTGQAPSRLNEPASQPARWRYVKMALQVSDRAILHERIAARFQLMLEQGLMEEVETLYRRGDLSPKLPSIRTIGYRQAWDYLTNRINYSQMSEAAIAATRQFARRQLTWLGGYPGVQSFESGGQTPIRPCLEYLAPTVGVARELRL